MILRLNDIVRILNEGNLKVSDVSRETGVHENTIRKIKTGANCNPTYEVMECLSDYLGERNKSDGECEVSTLSNRLYSSLNEKEKEIVDNMKKSKCRKISGCFDSLRMVYVLKKKGRPVYVGKTETHGISRASWHQSSGKDFDEIEFCYVEQWMNINKIESSIILGLMPKEQCNNSRYKKGSKMSKIPPLSVSLSDYLEK